MTHKKFLIRLFLLSRNCILLKIATGCVFVGVVLLFWCRQRRCWCWSSIPKIVDISSWERQLLPFLAFMC